MQQMTRYYSQSEWSDISQKIKAADESRRGFFPGETAPAGMVEQTEMEKEFGTLAEQGWFVHTMTSVQGKFEIGSQSRPFTRIIVVFRSTS